MQRWQWLSLVAMFLLVNVGGAQEANKAKDKLSKDKLVGKWVYVSGVKDGEKVPGEQLKGQTVEITKESFTLNAGEATFVIKYELDTNKKPARIDYEITKSPFGAGMTAKGIIALAGEELKICYDPNGGEAPKDFAAKQGTQHFSFVLKKAK